MRLWWVWCHSSCTTITTKAPKTIQFQKYLQENSLRIVLPNVADDGTVLWPQIWKNGKKKELRSSSVTSATCWWWKAWTAKWSRLMSAIHSRKWRGCLTAKKSSSRMCTTWQLAQTKLVCRYAKRGLNWPEIIHAGCAISSAWPRSSRGWRSAFVRSWSNGRTSWTSPWEIRLSSSARTGVFRSQTSTGTTTNVRSPSVATLLWCCVTMASFRCLNWTTDLCTFLVCTK